MNRTGLVVRVLVGAAASYALVDYVRLRSEDERLKDTIYRYEDLMARQLGTNARCLSILEGIRASLGPSAQEAAWP